jgi:hypothetical protein
MFKILPRTRFLVIVLVAQLHISGADNHVLVPFFILHSNFLFNLARNLLFPLFLMVQQLILNDGHSFSKFSFILSLNLLPDSDLELMPDKLQMFFQLTVQKFLFLHK